MQVNLQFVIYILSFCVQVIVCAAYFNEYSHRSCDSSIKSGYAPNEKYGSVNFCHYFNFSLLAFGIISVLFAICELGLAIAPDKFKFVDSDVLRGVVYILKGIATLGVSNDLGIAAGSLEIIVGAVLLILVIFNMIKKK